MDYKEVLEEQIKLLQEVQEETDDPETKIMAAAVIVEAVKEAGNY